MSQTPNLLAVQRPRSIRGTVLPVLLAAVCLLGAGCGNDTTTTSSASTKTASSDLRISTSADRTIWTDGTATCPATGRPASQISGTTAATEGIDGVLAFPKQSQDHVDGCVQYDVSPPVGGPHNPVWSNCGFYTSAVPSEHAVHDLEHGAVWIAYGPQVDAASLDVIRAAVKTSTHILASPYPGLGTTVVLSAWARQLTLDKVTDPRFAKFLQTYVQGPQTPELGAACSGGMGQ